MRKWPTGLAGISFAIALAGRSDHAICADPHPGWRVAACPKRLLTVKGAAAPGTGHPHTYICRCIYGVAGGASGGPLT